MTEPSKPSPFAPVQQGGKGKVSIGSMDEPNNKDFIVEAQYNPKELEITRGIPWQKTNSSNQSSSTSGGQEGIHLEFTGAEGRSMTLELLFDAYEGTESPYGVNVAEQVAKLEKLASVRNPKKSAQEYKRPHRCLVVWGDMLAGGGEKGLSCVIESLTTKYTMFSPDGVPLRATCVLKLKEASSVGVGKKK